MVECIDLAKKVLKGVKAQCTQVQEINRGVIVAFTDNKTDRRYRLTIVEETEDALS